MESKEKDRKSKIEAYDPFESLDSMNSFLESMARIPYRLFNGYLANPYKMPEVDVLDNGDTYTIKVDMPGVDKKDIKLKLMSDRIIIRAEKNEEKEEKKKGYYSRERNAVGYYRSVALPEEVKPETAKAKLDNGTLSIEISKSEAAKGRDIKID